MKVKNEVTIEKNVTDVWQVLGNEFDQIHVWASFFKDSKPAGEKKFHPINFSARDTVVDGKESTHSLDVFNAEDHLFSYTVTAGAPPFTDKAQAQWVLESKNNERCTVSITVHMELKEIIPKEKALEIKGWLSKSGDGMLEELKHYLETGKVHPRKTN
jgi:hypothetical protein